MKRGLVTNIILFLLFAAFFTPAVLIQRRGLENVLKNPPFQETWLLSSRSGQMLRIMTLRYDMVAADFLWLRAIQSFGGRGMTDRDWKPVYNMFDTITELDPYFEQAYTFGNLVIGDEGGQQGEGLKLLRKGMFNLIRQYRIPFEGMYVAQWSLHKTDMARWFGRMTVKRPDMPDWVPRVVAYLEVEAGEYYIGYRRFLSNLLQAIDVEDVSLQGIALNKVRETIDKWNMHHLLQAYDEYTTATGAPPKRIEDLADMPALQKVELPRMSDVMALIQKYSEAIGGPGVHEGWSEGIAMPSAEQVAAVDLVSTATEGQSKLLPLENVIFQQSLKTRSGIPEDPHGTRYVLNLTQIGFPWAEKGDYITNAAKLQETLQGLLKGVREVITERREELGRFPKDLHEVFYTDFNTTEPYGGKFIYDPTTGDFKSSTFPQM